MTPAVLDVVVPVVELVVLLLLLEGWDWRDGNISETNTTLGAEEAAAAEVVVVVAGGSDLCWGVGCGVVDGDEELMTTSFTEHIFAE